MKKILTFVLAALASVATFAEVITCAQADAIARALADGESTEVEYTVEGYATYVISPIATKLSFWMADEANAPQGIFEAYNCTGQTAVVKGDKVQVTGKIQHFNDGKTNTGEIFGGTVVVVTPAPIDENIVVFNSADFTGKGAASPGAEVNIEKNGITLHVDKALGTDYHLRVFQNSSMSISSSKRIVKLEFEFDPYQDTPYDGGLDKEVCVESTAWNFTASASQARFKSITVYLGDGECGIVPPVVTTITIAQALEIAKALKPAEGKSIATSEKYDVRGYVTGYKYNKSDILISFWMGDIFEEGAGEFQAYNPSNMDAVKENVEKGDYISIVGPITNYNNQSYEVEHGVLTIISKVGLNNIKSTIKAKKVIENGQFMIEANGMRFNVLGANL